MSDPIIRVDNLHYEASESIIHEIFANFGKLVSVKYFRDFLMNVGHALITFDSLQDATLAMTEMQGKIIYGHSCVISWANKSVNDVTAPNDNIDNILIENMYDDSISHLATPFVNHACLKIEEALLLTKAQKTIIMQMLNCEINNYNSNNNWHNNIIPSLMKKDSIHITEPLNESNSILTTNGYGLKNLVLDKVKKYINDMTNKVMEIFTQLDDVSLRNLVDNETGLHEMIKSTILSLNKNICDEYIANNQSKLDSSSIKSEVKLEDMEYMEAKWYICGQLYPKVQQLAGCTTNKLMAILLDMDNSELINLLDNSFAFKIKMDQLLEAKNNSESLTNALMLAFQAKKRILNFDGKVQGQMEEVNRISSLIDDIQASLYDQKEGLNKWQINKQETLFDLNQLIKAISDCNDSIITQIPLVHRNTDSTICNKREESLLERRNIPYDTRSSNFLPRQIDLSSTSQIAEPHFIEAKQLLGEKLYPLVSKHAGDLAGKITGMFLELDNTELLYMIENENSLTMKIEEAILLLNSYKVVNMGNRRQ